MAAAFLKGRPMLLRLLVARLGSREEAEDVLQDMWLRLDQTRWHDVDQPSSFFYKVAANLATDRRIALARRGARESAWLEIQPLSEEFADAERQIIARDQLATIDAAIQAMPERMRAALIMFRFEEQSHRAIAGRLGITVSGVEKLLRRAYRLLHAAVEDHTAESGRPHRLANEGGTEDGN